MTSNARRARTTDAWGDPLPGPAADQSARDAWGDRGAARRPTSSAATSSRFAPVRSLEEARRNPWGRPVDRSIDPAEFATEVTEAQSRIAAAWTRSHPGSDASVYTDEATNIIRNRSTVTTDRGLIEALHEHADFLGRPLPQAPGQHQSQKTAAVREVVWKPGATPARPPTRRQATVGQFISEASRLGKIIR